MHICFHIKHIWYRISFQPPKCDWLGSLPESNRRVSVVSEFRDLSVKLAHSVCEVIVRVTAWNWFVKEQSKTTFVRIDSFLQKQLFGLSCVCASQICLQFPICQVKNMETLNINLIECRRLLSTYDCIHLAGASEWSYKMIDNRKWSTTSY